METLAPSNGLIRLTDSLSIGQENNQKRRPPLLIRGSECKNVSAGYSLSEEFTAQIDWIQGIIPLPDQETLNQVIEMVKLPGDQVVSTGKETRLGRLWQNWGITAYGFWFAWDDPTPERPGEALIQIKGAYCSYLGPERLYQIAQTLANEFGFRPTRVDFALDDYSKSVTPRQCFEAGKAGHFARFRDRPSFHENAKNGGTTTYFGSRKAEKLLRIYDKFAESGGQIDAIRWELAAKDNTAQALFANFIATPWSECPYDFVARAVTGCIEFCEKPEGVRRFSSYSILPFWQAFKAKIGQVRIPVPREPQTLQKRLQWVKSSCSRTFAYIQKFCTNPHQFYRFIDVVVREGESKFSDTDRKLIEVWKSEFNLAMVT